MIPTRNALHVLRLVWRAPSVRRVSTAVDLSELDLPKRSTFFPSDQPSLAEKTDTIPEQSDFLEPDTDDYQAVAVDLPQRTFEPVVLPWPTLFPSTSKEQSIRPGYDFQSNIPPLAKESPDLANTPPSRLRSSEPLARLVLAGDLEAARAVHDDLRQVQSGQVHERLIYMHPAMTCLKANDTKGFLFWMNLYPNRPATRDNRSLRARWYPIIFRILRHHTHDTQFVTEFIYLSARKCLLPTVMPPFIRFVNYIYQPQESVQIMRRAIELFRGATVRHGSMTERGTFVRSIVDDLEQEWWNNYLRSLIVADCKDEALALYRSQPVLWDDYTMKVASVDLEGDWITETDGDALSLKRVPWSQRVSKSSSAPDPDNEPDLPKRVRHALQGYMNTHELFELILRLRQVEATHPTFIDRFGRRFIRQANAMGREKTWWRAIIRERQRVARDHQAVIRTHREHFLWIGLPPISDFLRLDDVDTRRARIHPTSSDIYVVIRSLIAVILETDEARLPAFHEAYLAHTQTLLPALRPDVQTHYEFIYHIRTRLGTQEGLAALESTMKAGYDPGPLSIALILPWLIRDHNLTAVRLLLDRLESGETVGDEGLKVGIPSLRTYKHLLRVLEYPERREKGEFRRAVTDIVKRAKRQYGPDWRTIVRPV